MDMPLSIEFSLPSEPIYLGRPCPIRIDVVNRGSEPVMINRRLAIGYLNSLSREIYIQLLNPENDSPAFVNEVDYQRDFSSPSDYGYLPPGGSITKSYDLFEWYEPVKPGTYRLKVFYQADEPLATLPDDILRGVFSGKSVSITVLPKKLTEQK